MGLLRKVQTWGRRWRNSRSHASRKASSAGLLRLGRFETMEPRQLLSASPIQIGAVYYEDDSGDDTSPDQIEITYTGGAAGTQLTQLVIDTDKAGDGLSLGDVFFDIADGGKGVYGSIPVSIVDKTGIDSVNISVTDGGTKMILTFTGFDPGEKLVFTVDVDEQGYEDDATATAEGGEFAYSKLTGTFTAPHYYEATGTGKFKDDYSFGDSGLDLPDNDYCPPNEVESPIQTAGTFFSVEQTPLPITIAGTVFEDTDLDNQRDDGEQGIVGVTLTLLRLENGQYVSTGLTTVTGAGGTYQFQSEGLVPGTYRVVEDQPDGYFSIGATAGTVDNSTRGEVTGVNEISTIELLGGEDSVHNDFAEAKPATLSGYVYHDADNDGVFDEGEKGIGGAEVFVQYLPSTGMTPSAIRVTTNASGYWSVGELMPGNYRVDETTPDGYFDGLDAAGTAGGAAQNPGDRISGVHLNSGQAGKQYNFGELLPCSISGWVGVDLNGNGQRDSSETSLPGVTVYLLDASGNQVGSTTTGTNGEYAFVGLEPGTYQVKEAQPSAYYDGADLIGTAGGKLADNDWISQITLTSGTQATGYDFLEILPSSISGRVVADANGNGQYDDGEELLAGVVIHLVDASGKVIKTTTTDTNGEYEFTNLEPGTYGIQEEQPEDYYDGADVIGTVGGELDGNDSMTNIVLVSGTIGEHYDFYELVPVTLSGFVYVDDNNNGVRNANEAGIAGVTLTLLDATGKSTGITTKTDANGYYQFTDLVPGQSYGVAESQPTGYLDGLDTAGTAGGTAQNPGDKITGADLGFGVNGKNYNFGEVRPASISGQVFVDKDDDGLIDSGETGIAGVKVWLLDSSGERIQSTTTDAAGHYTFTNLEPGTYSVEEVQPGGYYDGKDHLGTAGGTLGNDQMTGIVLSSGEEGKEYNFGEILPAKLSGYVFQDGSTISYAEGDPEPDPYDLRDGQHTADDTPIAGVVLTLGDSTGAPVLDSQGRVITAVTDANGYYEFTNLKPGVYTIIEGQPTGYTDFIDTAGSEGGTPVNANTPVSPEILRQLTIDPKDDAILRVVIAGGDNAVSYNFSEVKLVEIPDDPPPPTPDPPEWPDIPTNPVMPGDSAVVPASFYAPAATQRILSPFLGGGSVNPTYTWHLSVIDAGQPRRDRGGTELISLQDSPLFNPVSWTGVPMDRAQWVIADTQGTVTNQFIFGVESGIPVTGDFDGNGVCEVAVFFDGVWFIDLNGNGVWDQGDLWVRLGKSGDQPVTGDWDGDGKTDIGIFGPAWVGDGRAIEREPGLPDTQNDRTGRPKNLPPSPQDATAGWRTLKRTSEGPLRSDVIDHVFQYGSDGDRAVAGDFNGDGVSSIGVYRGGTWYLDMDGNGQWSQADILVQMGTDQDIPVVGDWNGDGTDELGLFHEGTWQLDINGDHRIDANDRVFQLGGPNDKPVTGDFNGDGVDEVAVYQETFTKPNEQASTEAGSADVALSAGP